MAAQMFFDAKLAKETGAAGSDGGMSGMDPSMMMGHPIPPAGRSSSIISLPYEFPTPGNYRVWVQFKTSGQIMTAIFDASAGAENSGALLFSLIQSQLFDKANPCEFLNSQQLEDTSILRKAFSVQKLVDQVLVFGMRNLTAHQTLLSSGQKIQLCHLATLHTLLIVGTKMAKSDPSWMTKEHKVSRTAIRTSLFDDSNTRTRGWIIREA